MPKVKPPTTPSYRTIERRRSNGGTPSWGYSGTNTMIHGAAQNSHRTQIPFLDKDTHRTVSNLGRRTLMTLGRWLFWNFPSISGAILEQAMFASENFQPQFWGEDKAWGDQAEAWLLEWERICDIEGWPYDMNSYREMLVLSDLREGDQATLLTETDGGYPQIQVWPSHRIGCSPHGETEVTESGPFDGYRICEGVIIDDHRRAVGYRILDESGYYLTDVPANAMFLSFLPKAADQVRGFSGLASAIFDCQDLKESKYWELIAQKAAAAVALLESNETGSVDESRTVIKTRATHDSTGAKQTVDSQEIQGGMYRYFKAGTNADLKAFSYDRPGANVMTYQDRILRDAFQGLEWSMFFSTDPAKNGTAMRIIVEKINRVVRKRQRMIVQALRRIHGYAISKAIKLGLLPESDEWWKWEYQFPAMITADKRYDSDVDVQEYDHQFTTLKTVCAKRGGYWEDTQDQHIAEAFRRIKRAREIGKAMGMDEADIKAVGAMPQKPGAAAATPPPTEEEPPKPDEDEEK